MERQVLFRNPYLKNIFMDSHFIFNKPEVINEISFETKGPVENHMLMTGDAAGMITPVCGNGMAIAIRSGKLLAEAVVGYCNGTFNRAALEQKYATVWRNNFATRLWFGRQIQSLFGNPGLSNAAVNLSLHAKPLASLIVRQTHGDPF
jgi:flavin-dependent dehydrogenase